MPFVVLVRSQTTEVKHQFIQGSWFVVIQLMVIENKIIIKINKYTKVALICVYVIFKRNANAFSLNAILDDRRLCCHEMNYFEYL